MKRRTYLATVPIVALAGCQRQSQPEPGEPTNESPTNESDPEPTNETDGNESDPEPEGPTDEDLAAEHIAEAQAALSEIADGIVRETGLNATFADLDASVSLRTTAIEDNLRSVREATDEADGLSLPAEQTQAVDDLSAAEEFLRALLEVHTRLSEIQTDVGYLLEDAEAGAWDRVESAIVDIRRAADEVETRQLEGRADVADSKVESVDALSEEDVVAQRDRVVAEANSITPILDAVEKVPSAEEAFDTAYENRFADDWSEPFNTFKESRGTFDAIASASGSHGFDTNWVPCYAGKMRDAADAYMRMIDRREYGGDWKAARDEGDRLVDGAENCEVSLG